MSTPNACNSRFYTREPNLSENSLDPVQTPKAGRFWSHDDRFDGNAYVHIFVN